MKILISAAEASSDTHGAALLRAIKKLATQNGATLDAFGIGGPKLKAGGLRPIVDSSELLVMGSSEIIARLPKILRALSNLSKAAKRERPDVAVVIDYPDFHMRLAKRLRKAHIPVVYYIPPKVWVWRKSRINQIKTLFAKVLCIFPFEEAFYAAENVQAKYVGNPLTDELPLRLSKKESRLKLSVSENDKVVVLMPGSRPAEIKRHLTVMIEAASDAAAALNENLKVLIPFPMTTALNEIPRTKDPGNLDITISQGNAHECLVAADAGLIKSGTSTLEAALLGCPHAVIYKPSPMTAFIFSHIMRYKGPVGLVNLVAGFGTNSSSYIANEILCDKVTKKALTDELVSLFVDEAKLTKMRSGFKQIRTILRADEDPPVSPSELAAKEVLALCARF